MPGPLIPLGIAGGAALLDALGFIDLPGQGPNESGGGAGQAAPENLTEALALLEQRFGTTPPEVVRLAGSLAAANPNLTGEQIAQTAEERAVAAGLTGPVGDVLSGFDEEFGITVGDTGEDTGGIDIDGDGVPDISREAFLQSALGGGRNLPAAFGIEDLRDLGLSGENLTEAFLNQFGLGASSQAAAGAAASNAQTNRLNALTNAARQRADEAYQQGQLLVQQGQLDLAERQFAASDYWTGVANDLSQRQFQLEAAATPAQIATQMFGASEQARQGRGALELGSANTFSGLASLLGNLATTQMQTGIDLLTNPRNATAAFLLGQGVDADAASQFGRFNVERLLGIDPAQIQTMIQSAAQAAGAASARANEPQQFDLQAMLDALANAAKDVAQPGDVGEAPGTGEPQAGPRARRAPAPAPEPEENFQRRPTGGTVTTSPTNRVVQQAFDEAEPARGGFVSQPAPTRRGSPTVNTQQLAIANALFGDSLTNIADPQARLRTIQGAESTLRRLLR